MKLLKYSIFAIAFVAAFALPRFVSAQTIDNAQMKALNDQQTKVRSMAPADAAYPGELDALKALCISFDTELVAITKGKYGAELSVNGPPRCGLGTVDTTYKASEDESLVDTYRLKPPIPGDVVIAHINSISDIDSPNTFDAAKYKEIVDAAASPVNPLAAFVNMLVEGIGNITASILALIAAIALKILDLTLEYTTAGAKTPDIVFTGWVIIRDFMNIMFVVALIVMGIATIIRVESYNFRNLLFRLIVMAILINFSQIIAITLIDFSNMLINIFKPEGTIMDFGRLIFQSYITNGDGLEGALGYGRTPLQGIPIVITKWISLVVLSVSFLMVAGLMVVRLIGLWFLIMLSPAAYALGILPRTKSYADMWWDYFIKYLIWGPVVMFFFRISFMFMKDKGNNVMNDSIVDNLFISSFIFFGFMIAKKTGMAGASAVTGYADSVLKRAKGYGVKAADGAKTGAWAGAKYVGRGTAIKKFGKLAGDDVMEKFGERMEKRTAKWQAYPVATAKGMKYKYWDKPGKDRTDVIEAQKREYQIKNNYLGDFDKESATTLKGVDVLNLVAHKIEGDAALKSAKVDNIIEHGTKGAKDALLYSYQQGLIKVGQYSDPKEYEQVKLAIRELGWKMSHRRGEMDDKFMAEPKSTELIINLKRDGLKNFEEKEGTLPETDTAGREQIESTLTIDDHKIRAKNMFIKFTPKDNGNQNSNPNPNPIPNATPTPGANPNP